MARQGKAMAARANGAMLVNGDAGTLLTDCR